MDFRSVSRGSCGSSPLHTDSELYSPVGQGPFSVDSIHNMSPTYLMENFSMRVHDHATASVIWDDACKDFKGVDAFELGPATVYERKNAVRRGMVHDNLLTVVKKEPTAVFEMPDFSDMGEDYDDSPPDFVPSSHLDGGLSSSCYKPVAIRVTDSHQQSSPQPSPGSASPGHLRVVPSLRSEDLCKPEAVAQHVHSILSETADVASDEVNYELIESATPYTDATKPKKASKKNHVKRPLNAFMLWAKDQRNKMREGNPELHNASISKHLGIVWQGLDRKIKDSYQARAQQLKVLHEKEYPGYKYQPRKNKNKKAETVTTESGRVSKPTAKTQVEPKARPSRPRKPAIAKSKKAKVAAASLSCTSAASPLPPSGPASHPHTPAKAPAVQIKEEYLSEDDEMPAASLSQQSPLEQYMLLLQQQQQQQLQLQNHLHHHQQQQSLASIEVTSLSGPIVIAQAISSPAGLGSGLPQHLKITGGMVISHKTEPLETLSSPMPTVQIIPGPIPASRSEEAASTLEPSEYRVVPPFLSNDEVEEFFSVFPSAASSPFSGLQDPQAIQHPQPLLLQQLKEEPMDVPPEQTTYSLGDTNIFQLFPISEQLPPDIFE